MLSTSQYGRTRNTFKASTPSRFVPRRARLWTRHHSLSPVLPTEGSPNFQACIGTMSKNRHLTPLIPRWPYHNCLINRGYSASQRLNDTQLHLINASTVHIKPSNSLLRQVQVQTQSSTLDRALALLHTNAMRHIHNHPATASAGCWFAAIDNQPCLCSVQLYEDECPHPLQWQRELRVVGPSILCPE